MSGTWWTRLSVILACVFWGVWMLYPTVAGDSAQVMLQAQADDAAAAKSGVSSSSDEDEPEVQVPWYQVLVPESRINLGLDLQGGIDLTLTVEVGEAVISTVHREIGPLKTVAETEGLRLGDVRRARGRPTLLLRGAEGVGDDEIRRFMTKSYGNIYEFESSETVDGESYLGFTILPSKAEELSKSAVQQALETLRSRIDETGVKEPSIVLKGGNRINVQLPGIDNIEQAVAAIGTTAVLEFMMVDEEANEADVDRGLLDAQKTMSPEEYEDDAVLSDWMARNGKLNPKTRLFFEYEDKGEEGQVRSRPVVVMDRVVLTGDDVNDAHTAMNQYNEPYVALEFKPRGGNIFCEITQENVGRRFAIVLDNKVRSAPVIREAICGGRASIEMGVQDYQQALGESSVLSLVLRTGALPAPVTIGDVRTVGASLGQDAIEAGKLATTVGFGLVLCFMIIYYKKSGVVSAIALITNIVLVMAMLAAAGATLTLPGIAGIALTVGMAVDCNIIIYERIREELRLGKNARAAVDSGFSSAITAVLDANITTFIAGVVLYTYGTGPIKGFSVTLMIGIITTLFTGIFVSRVMMDFLARKANKPLSI
jgi:preprotein translocase subunit SecD